MTDDNSNSETNEEEGGASPVFPSRGPDKDKMASEYLPDSGEWAAKTILDITDPGAVAALSQIGKMYPEVEELQPFVDGTMEEFFKSQTSVAGLSREEYNRILEAMHGGTPGDGKGTNVVMQALGADDED